MDGDRMTHTLKNGFKIEYEEKDGIWWPLIKAENNPEYDIPLGKYGNMALKYWKENKGLELHRLVTEGILMETMHKIEDRAREMMDQLQETMLEADPIRDPDNTMETYRHRQRIHDQAEEIVLREVIYS